MTLDFLNPASMKINLKHLMAWNYVLTSRFRLPYSISPSLLCTLPSLAGFNLKKSQLLDLNFNSQP